MGRGAAVCPTATSASQEKAQLLVQPLHKSRVVTLPCNKGSRITSVRKECNCLSPVRTASSQIEGMGSPVSVICPVLSIRKQQWGGFSSKFPFLFTSLALHNLLWFYYPWWERRKMREENYVKTLLPVWWDLCDSQQFCRADFNLRLLPLWATSKVHKSHKGMEVNRFSPAVQDLPLH